MCNKRPSGGLTIGVTEVVMKDNGAMFGTLFNNSEFIFESTDNMESSKLNGLKYVQENTQDIYKISSSKW